MKNQENTQVQDEKSVISSEPSVSEKQLCFTTDGPVIDSLQVILTTCETLKLSIEMNYGKLELIRLSSYLIEEIERLASLIQTPPPN